MGESMNICEEKRYPWLEEEKNFIAFHWLEYSENSINLMFKNCGADITDGKYIQRPDEIVSKYTNAVVTKKLLDLMLDNIEREFGC